MHRMNTAMRDSSLKLRFRSRESNRANDSAKWPTTRSNAITFQPLFRRIMYQGISSGRLPDQMMRNWETEKYAQTITMAKSNFPKSWRCRGVRMSDIGLYLERNTIRVMRNAIPVSAWLAITSSGNMVENQLGSIESSQSIDMKVTVNARKTIPGPAKAAILR